MDIRDITQEPEKTDNKLKTIFSLQKELLNHYQKIEGLPKYPIEVNVKASQIILKDFIGRITEELAEGLESLDKILMVKDKYQDVTRSGEHYKGTVVPMIQNFNEECADALHFAVELLIFSGVDEDMIMSYVHTYIMNLDADEYSIEDGKRVPTDWLQLLVKAARSRNSRKNSSPRPRSIRCSQWTPRSRPASSHHGQISPPGAASSSIPGRWSACRRAIRRCC